MFYPFPDLLNYLGNGFRYLYYNDGLREGFYGPMNLGIQDLSNSAEITQKFNRSPIYAAHQSLYRGGSAAQLMGVSMALNWSAAAERSFRARHCDIIQSYANVGARCHAFSAAEGPLGTLYYHVDALLRTGARH